MFRRTRSSEARSLGETHRQLDIALGAMTQGLCLYDQANKLQLWNNRFAELYNVKDALRRGMTFEEVICLTVSLGLYGERSVADVLEIGHDILGDEPTVLHMVTESVRPV